MHTLFGGKRMNKNKLNLKLILGEVGTILEFGMMAWIKQ
jgi:hypothetical protein